MTEDEVIGYVAGLADVVVWTAAPGDGSPEIAWGDSFFYYSPDGTIPRTTQPFATIVTKDHPGDATSRLDRPGTFRVNIAAGKDTAASATAGQFIGAAGDDPSNEADPITVDVLRLHPVYGAAGWVAVTNPGPRTDALTRRLLTDAHTRARTRYQRRNSPHPAT
jgi:hypothetical protein